MAMSGSARSSYSVPKHRNDVPRRAKMDVVNRFVAAVGLVRMNKGVPAQQPNVVTRPVVGKEGRVDTVKVALRVQEVHCSVFSPACCVCGVLTCRMPQVARAFELLHSEEADSEEKLAALLNGEK